MDSGRAAAAVAEEASAVDTLSLLSVQLTECCDLLETHRCACGRSDASSLQHRLSAARLLAAERCHHLPHSADTSLTDRMQPLAQQMVHLLQQKLSALSDRRNNLRATNSWTKDAQLKNFAERIAYEAVLLSQVAQAHRSNVGSIKLQDLMESHRKMAFLEKKLTNPEFDLDTMAPLEFYTSMLAEKLVVTGEVLSSVKAENVNRKYDATVDATCLDLQGKLLERERQLARLVMNYKEEKLHEVAVVMVRDRNAPQDESVLVEEARIREAWTAAHLMMEQEIVNHQTSQSLFRICHSLNPPSSDNDHSKSLAALSLTLCSAEAIDRMQTAAEESLRQEMEESVLTLSQNYEKVLSQYRAGDSSVVGSVTATMEEVLNEFAGVMAQKAFIDGHLALLQDEFEKRTIQTTQDSLIITEDNKDPMESAGDVLDSEAHLLMFLGGRDSSVESLIKPALSHAEFTFLYNKASEQCTAEATSLLSQLLTQKSEVPEPTTLASSSSYRSSTRSLVQSSPIASDRDQDPADQTPLRSAVSPSKVVPSPKARRRTDTRKSRRSSDITGMTGGGCRQCEELRHELTKLKKKLQMQISVSEGRECENCPKLLDTIESLELSQRARAEQEEGSSDPDSELTSLKQRIIVVEASYEAQIAVLNQKLEEALAAEPGTTDDSIRQRYQLEIEQLRGLCEKGLGTMEGSQQRLLAESQEKHRQELAQVQAEKEQALAEETQATLAALDAMKKAHEAEVQREVAKIEKEFLRKMQSGHDFDALTQEHEAEMRDMRREILSLSEKYSVKCLQSSDLEAKIENLNKLLAEATKMVAELEARNAKLRAQLTERIEAYKSGACSGDTEADARLRGAEAVLKDEKIARMGAQLQQVQASHRKGLSSSSARRGRSYGDPKSSLAKN